MKYLLLILLTVACTKDIKTPEGLLVKFTEDITTKKMDRDYYSKYTTGKMKESIDKLSDEEFDSYGSLSRVENAKIDILKKNCTGNKCSLTYIVKYDYKSEGSNEKDFKSEVKKVASLVKVEETWKIEDVSNIKTYHESVKPINALEEN